MKKPFKYSLENTVQKLIKIVLVTGCILAFSGDETNMSTELPPEYSAEIMEIPMPREHPSIKTQYLTLKERRKLLNYVKEVGLPSYLSRDYVNATIKTESRWNARAVSEAGARGLMQIIDRAWSEHDSTNYLENVFKPEKNILVGLKHLKKIDEDLKKNYAGYSSLSDKERQDKISATYNVGITKMRKTNWEISKMPRETRNHVGKIRRILGR